MSGLRGVKRRKRALEWGLARWEGRKSKDLKKESARNACWLHRRQQAKAEAYGREVRESLPAIVDTRFL